jgi:acyl carrier protein
MPFELISRKLENGMTTEQAIIHIQEMVSESLAAKGLQSQKLTEDTLLLGGTLNIDSLDLAGIVVGLTEITKRDPFQEGFIEFRTVGELASLYAGYESKVNTSAS